MTTSALILALLAPVAAAPTGGTAHNLGPTRGLVIVLRPSVVDELTRTALARVTGELTAARFDVSVLQLDPNIDPTPQVETVAPDSGAVAAVAIAHIGDLNGDTIAIWVCDRLGHRTTIQRMAMRGNDVSQDAEVLALEAIELIRVSIAGLWPAPARSLPSEASSPSGRAAGEPGADADADGSRPAALPKVTVGLGAAMLKDAGLASPQWMGSLTAMVIWPRGLAARAQVSGLGPPLTITSAGGTATLRREMVAVGLAWVFWSEERVQSLVTVGAGVEHVRGIGAAADPGLAHEASAWAPLGTFGIGISARLRGGLSLFADVNAILAGRSLVLRVAQTDTQPLSRPGILMNVGLQANF